MIMIVTLRRPYTCGFACCSSLHLHLHLQPSGNIDNGNGEPAPHPDDRVDPGRVGARVKCKGHWTYAGGVQLVDCSAPSGELRARRRATRTNAPRESASGLQSSSSTCLERRQTRRSRVCVRLQGRGLASLLASRRAYAWFAPYHWHYVR